MTYDLIDVETPADWRAYHAIRRDVLWTARGRGGYDENHADEFLPMNYPLMLTQDGEPVGATRLDRRGSGVGIVRLVAIRAQLQGQGLGRVLSQRVEVRARQLGITTLFVNAVSNAVDFYAKTGWEPFAWDPTELTNTFVVCVQMRKQLSARP